jgi:transposase-like protein
VLVCGFAIGPHHTEEMMRELGLFVDHVTVHRRVIKVLQVLAAVSRRHKRPVDQSWRMDEICTKVSGQWEYLYRAADREGDMVVLLLTAKQ